jgi:SAM-dependent methyltransferase/uncharacterized protein YbaR (Trm112 family)
MRERLVQWLACPTCNGNLSLKSGRVKGKEVIEGALHCPCGEIFPIVAGVPRLLSSQLRHELLQRYPAFFQRQMNLLANHPAPEAPGQKKQTLDRFGYEWTYFSEYDCDNFKRFIEPLPDNFFRGKIGLDAGCGAGRHAKQAVELGAEIVGVDLSWAVDAAYQKNADNKGVHIVQADIYNLPFKSGIFDLIYSLGVLHHLPEPERGFQSLLPVLTEGGSIFVWLYAHTLRKVFLELLRFFARPLSNVNIRRMAYVCNLIDYGICINLYRFARQLPVLSGVAEQYAPFRIKEYATHGFRVAYTDWFDRLSAPTTYYYKEGEMRNWLNRSGLANTALFLEGDSWWWLYGERKVKH